MRGKMTSDPTSYFRYILCSLTLCHCLPDAASPSFPTRVTISTNESSPPGQRSILAAELPSREGASPKITGRRNNQCSAIVDVEPNWSIRRFAALDGGGAVQGSNRGSISYLRNVRRTFYPR